MRFARQYQMALMIFRSYTQNPSLKRKRPKKRHLKEAIVQEQGQVQKVSIRKGIVAEDVIRVAKRKMTE
jgi:hypothetical protein